MNLKPFIPHPRFSSNSSWNGENKMVKIQVNSEKCTGCGTCADTCPVGVYEIKDKKSVPAKPDECLVCRACEVQCPEGAIQVIE
jgi:NAD-dependent dihydropyrimidine dehydrogenase PreA subunit